MTTSMETISSDLDREDSPFLRSQAEFVAKVGDATSNAGLFESLCLPAMDADHLEVTLPLQEVRSQLERGLPAFHLVVLAPRSV
jgi:hypothetical protein